MVEVDFIKKIHRFRKCRLVKFWGVRKNIYLTTSATYVLRCVPFNPIRPDPFEFLIGLSVCLGDTHSLTTVCNELEGCNFTCRSDLTHCEDPFIQI